MSSVLCRGLQSCLEPRLIEPSCVLRHKLGTPRSENLAQSLPWILREHSQNEEEDDNGGRTKQSGDGGELGGGWSFLEAFAVDAPYIFADSMKEDQKPYVHPLIKKSSSFLSKESLEMCTESLGSETGSEISESGDELVSPKRSPEPQEFATQRRTRGGGGGGEFPPPLLLVGASSGVQVRTHREGGRLVVEAAAVPTRTSCFRAERRGGRLRLCLVEENSDEEIVSDEEEEGEREEEEEEEVDEEGGRGGGHYGKSSQVGGDKEIGGLCSPMRCMGGLPSWGPFLKAMC